MPIIERFPRWATRLLVAAAFLLPIWLIVHAVTFWGHGIIDSEGMEFVLNYLQKRPFLAQIFDPQINDWGAYQARELSYVFDLIDARFFAGLLDRNLLVFVPLSGVLGLIAVTAIYFWGARKVFGLDAVTTCLLLSLFLSCIVVQASTPILYRSSKIILCVALLAFLFYLAALFEGERREVALGRTAILFLLGLLMALCDRQGFYYLISVTFILLLLWFTAKARREKLDRPYRRIVVANIAAIIATILYNRVLTPCLVHALNGYWPDFTYQNLPVSNLLDPTLFSKALRIFADQVSFFFGNIPFLVITLIIIGGLIVFFRLRRAAITRNIITVLAVSLIAILAIIGLLVTMIARHPAVYNVRDHEFWYYTLTIHAVILFGLGGWLSFVDLEQHRQSKRVLYIVIAILIALNVSRYPAQRETMIRSIGWFDSQYAQSQALVAQFKNDPPRREKLMSRSNDSFLDDQAHFLENVELSYLHLIGAVQTTPPPRP